VKSVVKNGIATLSIFFSRIMYPPPAGAHRERSLPFDFKGREISPKVPVGAGLFVRDHSS
jgi:hypothetical protein